VRHGVKTGKSREKIIVGREKIAIFAEKYVI
jgi:hypothetical protein